MPALAHLCNLASGVWHLIRGRILDKIIGPLITRTSHSTTIILKHSADHQLHPTTGLTVPKRLRIRIIDQ